MQKYTLQELLKKRNENGERVLSMYAMQVICGVYSRQAVYNILNGEAVIYTNELRQIADEVTAWGFPITVDNIDTSGLRVVEFGK